MAARKTTPKKGSSRDSTGRFRRGNTEGRGNPHLKAIAAFRRVAREAITPAQIEKSLAHLLAVGLGEKTRSALDAEGNEVSLEPTFSEQVAALKVLYERVLGKVTELQIAVQLPDIKTAADLPQASAAVLEAARSGELTGADVVALNATLAATRQHFADAEFERRLAQVEARQADE